jgi:hypothetical protein
LIDESILPSFTLDISDNDVPNAVEKIADWLEQTGGLYMEAHHPEQKRGCPKKNLRPVRLIYA